MKTKQKKSLANPKLHASALSQAQQQNLKGGIVGGTEVTPGEYPWQVGLVS